MNSFDSTLTLLLLQFRAQKASGGYGSSIYQSSFDTSPSNAWIDIKLPFSSFTAVRRDRVDYNAEPLYSSTSTDNRLYLGLLLSKFEYNGYSNPNFAPGDFHIDIADISFYRDPRPSFLLVSSAGAERINRLTDEEKSNDIPIVKLNPKVSRYEYPSRTKAHGLWLSREY